MPLISLQNINPDCIWAIWQITESSEELLQNFHLNKTDNKYFQEITHPIKQAEYLASRILAKELLNHWQSIYYGISKDHLNRPSLVNYPFYVSVSHAREYACAIIHRQKSVGIDMEIVRAQISRIAQKFLSETELIFAQKELDFDLEKLTILWAAKEALYKLYGLKQLSLKANIHIEPFQIAEKGDLEAFIKNYSGLKLPYQVHYEKLEDYFLAFVF